MRGKNNYTHECAEWMMESGPFLRKEPAVIYFMDLKIRDLLFI
jgi:hypothetical protein